LDPIANKQLAQHWPNIHHIHLDIPCLHGPFNYGGQNKNPENAILRSFPFPTSRWQLSIVFYFEGKYCKGIGGNGQEILDDPTGRSNSGRKKLLINLSFSGHFLAHKFIGN
jgi:hypothetical protein